MGLCLLFCDLDKFSILFKQAVDETSDIDDLGLGAGAEILLHLGIEIDHVVVKAGAVCDHAAAVLQGL